MKKSINSLLKVYTGLSLPLKVSFWYFVCSMFQKGLSFLTTPIFTRLLSTSEYGIVSVFNSWEHIIVIFVTMNLANSVFNVGLVRFDDDKQNFQSSMIGLELVWFFVTSCLFLSLYRFFYSYTQLDYKYIYLMLGTCFFSTILSMWSLRKRIDYNYKSLAIVSMVHVFVGILLSIAFVFVFKDRAFGRISGNFTIVVILGIICLKGLLKNGKRLINIVYWKFALKYNIPMIPHFLSTVILNQLDRIMIQNMVGLSQAGIYGVAYSSAGVVYIVNQALSASYNPWFLQRLKAKTYKGIKEVVNAILVLYTAALTVIILFAPEIMKFMAPADYYEGIYIIPPVASSMFFILLFNMFAPVEHFSLKTKFMGIASTISAVANIVLNYIYIKKFGYLAAGYTTLVCYIMYAIAHWIYMNKCCKEMGDISLFDNKKILFLSLSVVVISLLSAFLYRYFIIRYVFIMIIIGLSVVKKDVILLVFKDIKR